MPDDFSPDSSERNDPQISGDPSPKALVLADAINTRCPRSGKPIVASSLTTYRGYTVGFCNEHCRDDFAANIDERPGDRAFFDAAISEHRGADT